MNFQSFGDLRHVECKNVDCAESIPLPDQTLLAPTVYRPAIGEAFPPVYIACMRCGHVYGYTPADVRNHSAGHMLDQDPEMELHHRAIELTCGPDCKAPETIRIPTYAGDDEIALMAHVSRLKLFEVFCRDGQKIEAVPANPKVLFYS
jgi:hypothetical protein